MENFDMDDATFITNRKINNEKEPELETENKFVSSLIGLGWQKVDDINVQENFRMSLIANNARLFHDDPLTDTEFNRIYKSLTSTKVIEASSRLLQLFSFVRDNGDTDLISLLDTMDISNNTFQVMQQVKSKGKSDKNSRFDVTLLINGIPVYQVELKQRGKGLRRAVAQIQRYKNERQYGELFNFLQIFIVSNGVNTRYLANSVGQLNEDYLFKWKDENNVHADEIGAFADAFLTRQRVFDMICQFMIIRENDRQIIALRPYQIHAIERSLEHLRNSQKNGFIWHTTGSGKTITAFKLAQMVNKMTDENGVLFDKVIFISDRQDIDEQTVQEFTAFEKDSFAQAITTNKLVNLLNSTEYGNRFIVTTIQKLQQAINRERHKAKMLGTENLRIALIVDECHRSQAGQMQMDIQRHFKDLRMIGFTGTPIFATNENDRFLTSNVFDQQIHEYKMKDAIGDRNVLPLEVEYSGNILVRDEITNPNDIVRGLNMSEFLSQSVRLVEVAKDVLKSYKNRSNKGRYNAIFAVSNISDALAYYNIFKDLNDKLDDKEKVSISTIFSNDENSGINGYKDVIDDHNKQFNTNYIINKPGQYVRDVLKRFKKNQIHILIVVNMALTGFDSKITNQLYLDKSLSNHGLLQALSRTNRISDKDKIVGYIRCYLPHMKKNVDDAICLYSKETDPNAILVASFERRAQDFKEAVEELLKLAKTPNLAGMIKSEQGQIDFIKAYRKVNRSYNRVSYSPEFNIELHGNLTRQDLEDYTSHYRLFADIHTDSTQLASIIDDVDFDLEIFEKNTINVDYIMKLIGEIDPDDEIDIESLRAKIAVDSDMHSTKKEQLQELLNRMERGESTRDTVFVDYHAISEQKYREAVEKIVTEGKISEEAVNELLDYWKEHGDFNNSSFMSNSKLSIISKSKYCKSLKDSFIETNGLQDYR